MKRLITPLLLFVAATAPGPPAGASDAGDLKSTYHLQAFVTKTPHEYEADLSSLAVSRGKMTGTFLGIPVHGNVTQTGEVTYSGHGRFAGHPLRINKSKGQLSAAGNYFLGTITLSFSPTFGDLTGGAATFRSALPSGPCSPLKSAASTPSDSQPEAATHPGLFSGYAGFFHDNVNEGLEALPITLVQVTPGAKSTFTASILGVPVTGKLSAKGKFTLKGKVADGPNSLSVKGGGIIDASSQQIIGKLSLVGAGNQAFLTGKGTFELRNSQ